MKNTQRKRVATFWILLFFILPFTSFSQGNIGISDDGSLPDTGAMLDVKSSTKGILIPRMSTTFRTEINNGNPATGMLVFDTTTKSFWFFNGTIWVDLGESGLKDADQDTKIMVEKNPDEDIVRVEIAGTEFIRMDGKTLHLEAPGGSLFIGESSGINDNGIDDGVYNDNTFLGSYSGYTNTAGIQNVFVGNHAGAYNSIGNANIFIGYRTGFSNSEGAFNTFLGTSAGHNNSTGSKNQFFGYQAGYNSTTGYENLFSGYRAGYSNTEGYANTFIGFESGFSNTDGIRNVFIGDKAGQANIGSDFNVFLGNSAGIATTSGLGRNTFLGYRAGAGNIDGNSNLYIGFNAGAANTDGDQNLMIGYQAGFNSTGEYNHFIGYYSGRANTTGEHNHFDGYRAGSSNSIGNYNYFSGFEAGKGNTSGDENLFIGYKAGEVNAYGNANTAIGYLSGSKLSGGNDNVFMGNLAGSEVTFGSRNILIGHEAGFGVSNSNGTIAIGYQAGYNTNDGNNVFIGGGAGRNISDSYSMTIIGQSAGTNMFWPQHDVTILGAFAGYESFGSENTLIGTSAGYTVNGDKNTFIGDGAGSSNHSADQSVLIGWDAEMDDNIENSIGIGANVTVSNDNIVVLGNQVNRLGIGKQPVGGEIISLSVTSAHLSVGGDWVNASDENIKTNISEVDGSDVLSRLRTMPVKKWRYSVEDQNIRHIGPMAQDFYKAFQLGSSDKTVSTIDPAGVALAAVKELDKTQQELIEKTQELEGLKAKVKQMESDLTAIKALLEELND